MSRVVRMPIPRTSVARYHGTTCGPVLPWYRNTINTAVVPPHGTCHTAVIAIHHFNDYSFTWYNAFFLLDFSSVSAIDSPA